MHSHGVISTSLFYLEKNGSASLINSIRECANELTLLLSLKNLSRNVIITAQSGSRYFRFKGTLPMQKRDDKQILRDFRSRQTRQILAVAIALFLVLLAAVLYKRPDHFGEFSKDTVFALQLVFISAFIGFTAFNWRCPSCKKYLGSNINRHACPKCGTRLR